MRTSTTNSVLRGDGGDDGGVGDDVIARRRCYLQTHDPLSRSRRGRRAYAKRRFYAFSYIGYCGHVILIQDLTCDGGNGTSRGDSIGDWTGQLGRRWQECVYYNGYLGTPHTRYILYGNKYMNVFPRLTERVV